MKRKPDKYDKAVAYLTERPNEIVDCWMNVISSPAGCLFQYATPDGGTDGFNLGCLTTIRNKSLNREAWTPKLTKAIRADKRIPDDPKKVTVAHLKHFARWQRRLDKELNRQP